jgi:hypothetical protein
MSTGKRIERAILECRFPDGFLYLDKTGSVWKEFYARAKDDLDVRQVSPQTSQFVFKSINSSITFGSKNIAITSEYPKDDLAAFEDLCKFACKTIVEKFETSTFSRVGFRISFEIRFGDKKSADDAFFKLNLLDNPKATFGGNEGLLGIKGARASSGSVAFRAESDEVGRLIQIKTEERTADFNLPAFDLEYKKYLSNVLQVDVDSYTKKPTGAGGFDAAAFVRGNHREVDQLVVSVLSRGTL